MDNLKLELKISPSQDKEKKKLEEEKSKEKKSSSLKPLLRVIQTGKPELPLIAASTLTLGVTSSITLAYPWALGKILDISLVGVPTTSESLLQDPYAIAGGLFALSLARGGMVVARVAMLSVAGERVVAKIRGDLFESMLKQDVKYFDKNLVGDLMTRLTADSQMIQRSITHNFVGGSRNLAMGLGSGSMLFYTSPSLAMVSMCVIPPIVVGGRHFGKFVKKMQGEGKGILCIHKLCFYILKVFLLSCTHIYTNTHSPKRTRNLQLHRRRSS